MVLVSNRNLTNECPKNSSMLKFLGKIRLANSSAQMIYISLGCAMHFILLRSSLFGRFIFVI